MAKLFLQLWFSSDFGMSWSVVREFVKSWFLDVATSPTTLYVEYETPGQDNVVLSSTSMFTKTDDSRVVVANVEDFELRDDFMLATRRVATANGNATQWAHIAQFTKLLFN